MQTLYTCKKEHLKSGPIQVLSASEPGRIGKLKDQGVFLTEGDIRTYSHPLRKMFTGQGTTGVDIKILALLLKAMTGESFLEKLKDSPSEASQTGTPSQRK